MRKSSVFILACLMAVSSATATAKTRRRSHSTHNAAAARAAADKTAAEVTAGRERIAGQIKTLTHFVYLFGGVQKGIELAGSTSANRDVSPITVAQNQQSITKVRTSIGSVRKGLEQLETDFRGSPSLQIYYHYLIGIGNLGEAAENQAAANRFDDAGRFLLKAVDQLADALAAMR